MVLCIDLRADDHAYIDDLVILHRITMSGPNSSRLQAIDEADVAGMHMMRMYLPRPRDRVPSLGLGRQLTRQGYELLQILLPAPCSPSHRVTVIGTVPELPVTTAPLGLRSGNRPPDATFYQLAYSVGIINISVPAPGGPGFAILYRNSTVRRQPNSCLVLAFHRMDPERESMADESPRTDRTARSFPEHGLQIRASIKVVPVDMGGYDVGGGTGCEGSGPISLCIRVAIDACPLAVDTGVVVNR
jgi:hypothetical protein